MKDPEHNHSILFCYTLKIISSENEVWQEQNGNALIPVGCDFRWPRKCNPCFLVLNFFSKEIGSAPKTIAIVGWGNVRRQNVWKLTWKALRMVLIVLLPGLFNLWQNVLHNLHIPLTLLCTDPWHLPQALLLLISISPLSVYLTLFCAPYCWEWDSLYSPGG